MSQTDALFTGIQIANWTTSQVSELDVEKLTESTHLLLAGFETRGATSEREFIT